VLAFPAHGTESPDEAAAQAQLRAEQLMSADLPEVQTQATRGYWTRERMMSTPAMPFPETTAVGGDGIAAATPGPAGSADSSLPDPGALALAQEMYEAEWKRLERPRIVPEAVEADGTYAGVVNRVYSYPPPYARYKAGNNKMSKQFPWKTVGRLFFTVPGQGDASCTAAVAVGRAVWTAGHCVYSPGLGWHTNMLFVPAYKNGAWPYGSFVVDDASVLNGWATDANQAYDIAMVTVLRNNGMTVAQWVGNLGAIWGISAQQLWHSNGFPGNLGNSQYLMVCEGSLSSRWDLPGPDPVGMGCDMTYGSSGGPWWIKHNPYTGGAFNLVNSVVSGTPNINQSKEFFGPYFGSGAKSLHKWGRNR
jgi:V8-like Glu-specific endopeptidase